MDRGGLSGDDGPTHHGLFDISYLRCIPNIVHMRRQGRGRAGRHALHRAPSRRPHRHPLPARQRPRHSGQRSPASPRDRQGRSRAARSRDVAIFSPRRHAARGRSLATTAAQGRPERSPRHQPALRQAARPRLHRALRKRCSLLVTMEDHVLAGGFGCAVLESSPSRASRRPSSASAGPTSSSSTARSNPSAQSTASPLKPPSNASVPTSATLSRSKPTANPTSTAVASLCVFPSRPLRQKKGLTGAPELRASVRLNVFPVSISVFSRESMRGHPSEVGPYIASSSAH